MRTKLLPALLIILICNFQSAFSQTSVPGGMVSGHWTLAGSPFNIMGSVYIPQDSTLLIDPGVIVSFHTIANSGLTMLVQGQLLAVGTPGDTIVFTAADTTIGFHGIRFADSYIYGSSDTSKFMYCKIIHGKASGNTYLYENGGALAFDNWSNAVVSHCLISQCTAANNGGGIFCDSSSSPIITYNTISFDSTNTGNGGGGGIFCNNFSNPVITNNIISYNVVSDNTLGGTYGGGGGGISCHGASNPVISYNIISNNTVIDNSDNGGGGGGIYCGGKISSINNNTISYNSANSIGGGIACADTILSISNNIISYNSSFGGGIACIGIISSIDNNTILNNYGGGIYCGFEGTLPSQYGTISSISNNTIANNSGYVGGIRCAQGTITSINHNSIDNNGTGITCVKGSIISISNNTISHHTGGGINCAYQAGISYINQDTISYNSSPNGGGGINCNGGTILSISNDVISNDSSTSNGGGILCEAGTIDSIYNSIISNNLSGADGGGLWFTTSAIHFISNTTITNNSVRGNGGGFYCSGASPTMLNLTIANNSATQGGALYCDLSAKPNIYNCILWGDTAVETGGGNELFQNDAASVPSFYYCDVKGGKTAFGTPYFYNGTYTNNIDSNPLFVSPSAGAGAFYNGVTANWSLQSGSPCIDTGDPSYSPYPATDLAGNPRIVNGRIDIGAYEFQLGTGINTFADQNLELNIYPNPANNQITIHTSYFLNKEVNVSVLNVLGQTASPPALLQRRGEDTVIDVSKLSAGMYFLQIKSESKSVVARFVKE